MDHDGQQNSGILKALFWEGQSGPCVAACFFLPRVPRLFLPWLLTFPTPPKSVNTPNHSGKKRKKNQSRLFASFTHLILSMVQNVDGRKEEETISPRGKRRRRWKAGERPGLACILFPHRMPAAPLITPQWDPAHAHSLTNHFSMIGNDGCGSYAAGEG